LLDWVESGHVERTVQKNPAILRLWLGRRGADAAAILDAFERHVENVASERDSVKVHVTETENLCHDLAGAAAGTVSDIDVGEVGAEDRPGARWRMEWHLAVMRYCLRRYDSELENLEQLRAAMRRLLAEHPDA
jgi:hypothetical protein